MNFIDPFGLEIPPPPPKLGFTLDDVDAAFRMAHDCGIKGPDGKSMLRVYLEMLQSPQKIKWGEIKGIPQTDVPKDAVKFPCNPKVRFPKCNPKSGKKDIPGSGDSTFYFHAALLHELMHAYAGMLGQVGDTSEEREAEPTRIGNEFNKCIDDCMKASE